MRTWDTNKTSVIRRDEFEFLHELIGAKTEDILHDKDANSLN